MTEPDAYTVRRVPPGTLTQIAIALAVLAVISFVLDDAPSPFVVVVPVVVVGAMSLARASLVLRVDDEGERIGRGFGRAYGDSRVLTTTVPWSSVDEVLVVSSGAGDEQVAVRLRANAPLPWDVRGVIRDPAAPDPVPPELRTDIPAGKLDRTALERAVAGFGGGAVRVADQSA